jgi:hypothetical protein
MVKIDLSGIGEGALSERFNLELQRVLENIYDPNTDPKKVRKITIEVSFAADDNRDVVGTSIKTKTSLVPSRSIDTKILMGMDSTGKILGAELKSGVKGQMMIDVDGDVATDIGDKVPAANVVGFNRLQGQ